MGGFAWVTLATNDSYSLGALVLAHSLRRVNTSHQLAVLITPAVSQSMKEQLQTVFDLVKVVDVLDSKDETNLALLKRPELGVTFTKIHCWKLTEFEKCVFLDADTLVVRNCDELFEREELSAAPDVGWPDCFNTGVFVYKPAVETFNNLVKLAVEQGSFDGGDQGLLNQYFSDWATSDIKKHLPFVYNLTSVAVYSYIPAFKHYGSQIRIVHFIGAIKPWLAELDPATRTIAPAPGSEHLTPLLQNWWDIFVEKVHPAMSKDLECASGMLNLQEPACSNAIALETSDQPGIPEPYKPYTEKDDSRQINLPYHPYEVTSSSGESLTAQFLQIREQEILEKQRREQEKWEEEQRRIEEERRKAQEEKEREEKEREEQNKINEGNDDKHDNEPEPQGEMKEPEKNNEGFEPEHHEQPHHETHQTHFDFNTFYPDETCINTYLDQNAAFYQPFDSHHKSYEPYNENPFQPEPEQLPRFLTIPQDDQRQSFNVITQEWHPPPPPQQEEHHHPEWHYVPPAIPAPTYQMSTSHENLHVETSTDSSDLQKSKSMSNLTEAGGSIMTGNFWKSQPNVNVDANKKFAMPKLKPLLPKVVSSPQPPTPVYEARPKITQYTEFHMSSEYKDPVKLPSDNIGFVERQILKEKRTKSNKDAQISKKFGALPYIEPMEPYVPQPSPPKQKTPLKEIDFNDVIDYDLSSCVRQSGNKPLPKEKIKQKKENTLVYLPDLKPLVPTDDKREQFKKRKSDERLQVPEDGRRKKRDSRKARERKRKEEIRKPVVTEVYKHTTDVQEILKRLVNYTKDYQEYFKEPEEKVAKRKTPSPTILINGKELESGFSPIDVYPPSGFENGFDETIYLSDFMKTSSGFNGEKRRKDEIKKPKAIKGKKGKKGGERLVGAEDKVEKSIESEEEVKKTKAVESESSVEKKTVEEEERIGVVAEEIVREVAVDKLEVETRVGKESKIVESESADAELEPETRAEQLEEAEPELESRVEESESGIKAEQPETGTGAEQPESGTEAEQPESGTEAVQSKTAEPEVEIREEEPEMNKAEDSVEKSEPETSTKEPDTDKEANIEEEITEQTMCAVEAEVIGKEVAQESIVQDPTGLLEPEESETEKTEELDSKDVEESLSQVIADVETKENATVESEAHEPEGITEQVAKETSKKIEIGVVEPVKETKILKVESPLEELSSSIEIAEEAIEELDSPQSKIPTVAQKRTEPEQKDEDSQVPVEKIAAETEVLETPENKIKSQADLQQLSDEVVGALQEEAPEVTVPENILPECKDEAAQPEVPQEPENDIADQMEAPSSEISAKESPEKEAAHVLPEVAHSEPEVVASGNVEVEAAIPEVGAPAAEPRTGSLDQISFSSPKLDEDVTDEDDSFLKTVQNFTRKSTPERTSKSEQTKTDHDDNDSSKPHRKPSEEPFKHFRTFVKEQVETSQKGLLGIQEFTPSLPSKTFASSIVISHAIPHTTPQVPNIPLEEPTIIEEPQVQVQIPEQNHDSDSGVSTDDNINKSPRYDISPEMKEVVPEEPEKSWTSWADESSEITKSVAEMVLNEPEETLTETSKPLSYAVVAQKTPPVPIPTSSSSPRKSLFAIPTAQKSQKHSSKKSSQYRKPKPSQEKIEPVVDVSQKVKSSPKKIVEKLSDEVKKPANIFEVLPEESPDETVDSSVTKKNAKSKKNPKSVASKTKLAPSANSSTSRVNIDDEDVRRDESETLIADPNDNTGIAGAIANLSLESGTEKSETSPATSSAQEEYLRRQNWETGRIDYLGRDSFDNIWSKICETLDKKEPGSSESPDTQTSNETPNLVSTASIQLSQPQEEPRLTENVEITEYDSRGPVSLSMILNDQPPSDQPSEVEYIETLPPENVITVVADEEDIIFLKAADRHLYLSNIEEESAEEMKESSQELPQVDVKASGDGGGVGPERLDVLCTGVIENNNNKEGGVDVGGDFVVVEKEAVPQEQQQQQQIVAEGGIAEQVKTEEEKTEAKVEVAPKAEKAEESVKAEMEKVAESVPEPQAISDDQKIQEVVESAEPTAPVKVEAEKVIEIAQEKASESQPLEEKSEAVAEVPAAGKPEVVEEDKKAEALAVTEPEAVPETQKAAESSPSVGSPVLESQIGQEEPKIEAVSETQAAEAAAASAPDSQAAAAAVPDTQAVVAPPEVTQETQKVEEPAPAPDSLATAPQLSEEEKKVEVAEDVQKVQEPAEVPSSSAPEVQPTEKEQKVEIVSEAQAEGAAEVVQEPQVAQESSEAASSPAIKEQIAEISAAPLLEVGKEEEKPASSTESTIAEAEQKAETVAQEPEILSESEKTSEGVASAAAEEGKKPESTVEEKSPEVAISSEEKKTDAVVESSATVEENLPESQAAPEEPKPEGLVPESQTASKEPASSQEEKAATEEASAKAEPFEVQEEAKADSVEVEEKKKAENLETTLPEKKLEINPNPGPSHNPGNHESHNPGNPNPGNPNGKQDKKGEKKGVISKILEFVGVSPKQKKRRDESGETSKSIFYDTEAEKPPEIQSDPGKPSEAPPEPENKTEEPVRRSPIPHEPLTLIETSFVSAPVPSDDSPVPASSETIDEILKATDLSSISEQIPIVQSQQEDPTGEEVVQELIQIAEEASAKLAAEESNETIESITGKLILLTDGLKELVEPDVKEEAGLSDEDTLEISKVVAETFEKIISVLEDPTAYIEEEKKRSPSPRVVIKEIETIPETSVVSPTPPTSPEDVPKPKKDVKMLLVDETIPDTPPVVEKKTPIFLESNLIDNNQLIDTESLISDINDIIEEAKNYVESQFSLECSIGEVNGEEKFEGVRIEDVKEGKESAEASKEPDEGSEVMSSEKGEAQTAEKKVQFTEEIGIIAPVMSGNDTEKAEKGTAGVVGPPGCSEVQSPAIEEETAEVIAAESPDDASKKPEQEAIEEVRPVESEIQTEKPKAEEMATSGKLEQETSGKVPAVESENQTEQAKTLDAPQIPIQVATSEKSEQKSTKVEGTSQTEPPQIKSEPQTEDEFEEAVEEFPEETQIISGTLIIDALGRTRDKTPEKPPPPPEKPELKQPEEIPEPEEPVYSNVQKIDSKLVITPPPPPPPDAKFEVEEIKVTSEEERKKHKSQPSTSKLSGQILKAIPPPRRKAISEAKGIKSTGAIPKTKLDEQPKIISVVLEKPISETMSVDRTSTPPPVPPRRNKSKQRQPPLPPPKRKTKK